jgi:hypothetical protein
LGETRRKIAGRRRFARLAIVGLALGLSFPMRTPPAASAAPPAPPTPPRLTVWPEGLLLAVALVEVLPGFTLAFILAVLLVGG